MNQQRGFLLAAIALIGAAAIAMLLPFTGYILAAVVIAFILYPIQRRFRNHVPETAAASLILIGTLILAILPLLVTIGFVADDASQLVRGLEQREIPILQTIELQIEQILGQDVAFREQVKNAVRSAASYIAGSASQIVQLAASVAIGLSLMLFLQFYILRDGDNFVSWTKQFNVMPTETQERLYSNTATTTRAVIKGHVFVAILQGVIAGIGLFLTGVPNAFFWTFLMIILGFIPIIGTALIWIPAALYLILTGSVTPGILLLVYGGIVVGLTDNFARPLLVDEDADIHEVFILLGVVGGTLIYGPIGIFIGPIIFGVLKDLLEVYRDTYETL